MCLLVGHMSAVQNRQSRNSRATIMCSQTIRIPFLLGVPIVISGGLSSGEGAANESFLRPGERNDASLESHIMEPYFMGGVP